MITFFVISKTKVSGVPEQAERGTFRSTLVRISLFQVCGFGRRVANSKHCQNRGKQRLLCVAHFCIFLESFASLEIKETTKD
jgi:hypothetical protein